jgi:Holliday junction resolvasome RuvABC endonuclease subunit
MVKILLNLQNKLQEDEADALAVAITHAHLGLPLKQSL